MLWYFISSSLALHCCFRIIIIENYTPYAIFPYVLCKELCKKCALSKCVNVMSLVIWSVENSIIALRE